MKKLTKLLLPIIIISQLFALAGLGVYGDLDLLKYPSGKSGDTDTFGVEYSGFDNAKGIGFLFYIDAIPIVDLEFDLEAVGNLYQYTPYLFGNPEPAQDLPWGRISAYYTARKKVVGISIPLFAKAELYGGLGYNTHKVVPIMTEDIIMDAFKTDDLESALNFFDSEDSDADPSQAATDLAKAMLDKATSITGFHLQTGLRGKLLMLNTFVNARYTFAKDVIPGKSGFPSLWVGLALGI